MTTLTDKLFHVVVVTGAALTACEAAPEPPSPADASAADASAREAAAGDEPRDVGDAGEVADVSSDRDAGACPPDAERAVPPCYFIR